MKIGLHDAEREYLKNKHFPNYALMKISAWHKAQGDEVEWWNPLYKYGRVYSSKIFDFTPVDPYLPEDAVRGGTGYRDIPMDQALPLEIDDMFPDYSIYPECDFAIGYLTRGCPNNCRWCVVPKKEGNIRPYRAWEELVRKDTDKLILMDNNILACKYGISQLESLKTLTDIIKNTKQFPDRVNFEIVASIAGITYEGKTFISNEIAEMALNMEIKNTIQRIANLESELEGLH